MVLSGIKRGDASCGHVALLSRFRIPCKMMDAVDPAFVLADLKSASTLSQDASDLDAFHPVVHARVTSADSQPAPKLLSLVFVLNKTGRCVLLGLKKRGFGEGRWNGFGGKLEAGETMEQCAARELCEESGLRCEPTHLEPRGRLHFNMLSKRPRAPVSFSFGRR